MCEELNILENYIEKTDEPVIVGIDEAGRGPVIGYMVYAVLVMRVDEDSAYKDSKKLTPFKRTSIFKNIQNYAYKAIHPIYLTMHMENGISNLNEIAVEAVKDLLGEVRKKCSNVKTVYIDGLGNNHKYKMTLEKYFPYKFIIESKADVKYQCVSGASIAAKSIRDSYIDMSKYGSGYPSDENTVEWLKHNYKPISGFDHMIRHSWKTIHNILGNRKNTKFNCKWDKRLQHFFMNNH
ncbi:hypothetical protein NUSPORA_00357 [Nucleospora cyclopteri]